jgi:formate hydrogenlyase transcriptional activator
MEDRRPEDRFQEIVGESPALARILKLAIKAASRDAPVLILGETGSGKESIARAIHRISARRHESFVKVSCATVADGMQERKLFGSERGPSGNAVDRKVGRIEPASLDLADKGILFLDEIGHMQPDVQGKMLRLLEHGEFERLGGTRAIQANVRLIATTRCDLRERVAKQMFRADLYDRLNKISIWVPPLRERRDDIPLLARYFMHKFARRLNKHIESIPVETMSFLLNSTWPGNVRQLEILIERSVTLSHGPELRVPDFGEQQESKVVNG